MGAERIRHKRAYCFARLWVVRKEVVPGPFRQIRCSVPGCLRPSHDKPYCLKHFAKMDYAARLIEKVEEHQRDFERVRKGKVDLTSDMALEFLQQVKNHGTVAPIQMNRHLGVSRIFAKAWVKAGRLEEIKGPGPTHWRYVEENTNE